MRKDIALDTAIELAKIAVASTAQNAPVYPSCNGANDVADFIETLARRLETMN